MEENGSGACLEACAVKLKAAKSDSRGTSTSINDDDVFYLSPAAAAVAIMPVEPKPTFTIKKTPKSVKLARGGVDNKRPGRGGTHG